MLNSKDLDEMAQHEPSHQDLHSLQNSATFVSQVKVSQILEFLWYDCHGNTTSSILLPFIECYF